MKACLECGGAASGTRCRDCYAAYQRSYEARRSRKKAAARKGRLASGDGAAARLRGYLRRHEGEASCGVCHAVPLRLVVDHVTPLWHGGADVDSNVQALCDGCHAAKTGREATLRAVLKRGTVHR